MYARKAKTLVHVSFPYDQRLTTAVKTVPGRAWDPKGKIWKVPLELETVEILQRAFEGVEVELDPGLSMWMEEQRVLKERAQLVKSGDVALSADGLLGLYDFQKVGAKFCATVGRALLADEMGLGKTVEAIATIKEVEVDRGQGFYLAIPPNNVKDSWERDIETWYGEPPVTTIGSGDVLKDPKKMKPGWYIINWEKVRPRIQKLLPVPWTAIVADEAHKLSNTGSGQSEAMLALAEKGGMGQVRLAVTGTPVRNTVLDLYGILKWLYPERFTNYWLFFEQYIEWEQGLYTKEILGEKNIDKLQEVLDSIMIARKLRDVELELPPVRFQRLEVELGPQQRKMYDRMLDEFVAFLDAYEDDEDMHIKAKNWLTQSLRLKQIAGSTGIFYPEERHSAKLEALKELIEEAPKDEKFVVMSQFETMTSEVVKMFQEMGITFCEMAGGRRRAWSEKSGWRKAPSQRALEDFFREEDGARIFLATTQSGGLGLTLTAARYIVMLDLLWTPADNDQAWKRIHRITQTRACVVYAILAKDTIDFAGVLPTLRRKRDIIDKVMSGEGEPPMPSAGLEAAA